MDVVEIFLLCVVTVSVLVFLIIDDSDSFEKRGKACVVDEIESKIEDEVRKEGIPGNFGDEIAEVEEEERGNSSCREIGLCTEFGDDWEGIERTELEKIFGEAVVFCNNNGDQIAEVKLELYGLQQVALEGPCHGGSQPMAFNIPARSKWKAWQKLGNMSREVAMEKYVEILSRAVPRWKGEDKATMWDAAASEDRGFTKGGMNMASKVTDKILGIVSYNI